MISRSIFLRLLLAPTALLLFSAQPTGVRLPVHTDAVVSSHDPDALPRPGDFVTKKQRHAASLEEFFAIDDDPDQYTKPHLLIAPTFARSTRVTERPVPIHLREARPSHRCCAAPPTGPPHA